MLFEIDLLLTVTIRITIVIAELPAARGNYSGNDTKSVGGCRRGPAAAANFCRVYQNELSPGIRVLEHF